MTPSISVGSLQQGRKTLRAVLEILDGLWLDSTPDIEEDVLVSGTSEHRAIRSRALAARVKGQISVLLSRHPEDDTNSPRWVASYQDEVRRELKRYENVHQKNRSLSDVSSARRLNRFDADFRLLPPVFSQLYAANHAQLSARFNIPSDQYLSALEITRRIYHGLHNEVSQSGSCSDVEAGFIDNSES